MPPPPQKPGTVYLVGAGPGDPDLATVKALRLLREADCIVFDRLANPALLAEARPDAELIDAGKQPDRHKLSQEQINELLADRARAGRTVVRLKGGDPYVFGRGSEEAIHLSGLGVPVEVVPGVTSAIAGPAYAGIPVTHRRIAATVTFITGHEDPTKPQSQVGYGPLAKLAADGGTLCFYMGMGRLAVIVDELTRHGLSPDTPAAIIQWGTLPEQRSLRAPLADLPRDAERAMLGAPAIIVIGRVIGADPAGALRWFERRPLFGRRIIITRTRHQASELRSRLQQLGAAVLEAPTIEIAPPDDWTPIDEAIRRIKQYDWLILTSVNGVEAACARFAEMRLDARHLAGVRIAAIGEATASAMLQRGIRPDLVPTKFVAESLAAELIAREDLAGKRILMLRADIARPALRRKLGEAGAEVRDLPIYHTRRAAALPDEVLDALRCRRVHWVTFTSSSTVRHFIELLGEERTLLEGVKLASIGPITSQTAREMGLEPAVEAETHTIAGLVEALCRAEHTAAAK